MDTAVLDEFETTSTFESLSNVSSMASSGKSRPKPKTIEERYQKKSPIEHILHRPESYIGSVQPDTQSLWIWSSREERMVFQSIEFVPGLYKIFGMDYSSWCSPPTIDEILVNAADVKAREGNEKGRSFVKQRMTCLKVDIDQDQGTITVYNDGEGIPIEVHKEHQVYVPELIFGHLLTSDNYDDTEERVTGGRNGYGAKLTNIFSKSFTVECVDSSRKRKFRKTWRNNMGSSDPCKITEVKDTKDYVKVTFTPDLARFQVTCLDDGFVALLTKRVYDVAGCCGVKVWLNGKRLSIDNFKDYVDLYFPSPDRSLTEGASKPPIKIHEKTGRWEVVVSMSDGQFQQVSFVNSICTTKGGTHVNYVADPLVQAILKKVNAKNKGGMEIKAHHVKAHLWLFVNCLIVNPTFDSQTKETLTLKASQFGSKFTLAEKTINAVVKSDILESVLLWAKTKQQVELQKKMKGTTGRSGRDRISGIPKLEDANDAGTRYSESCTLILTEGESAKTSCVAGLSVVGRDRYGVFPLRGKLLNVREASFKQQVENQEIQAILKIMGLQVGKKFDSPKGLRYGSLMMMTDQDLDGSHIKGLLINMIAHYWPQLLKYRGFLKEFVTPIVKVSKGNQELHFFTLVEYDEWRQQNNQGKGWKIRYYKGLGTSTDREFKEYFSQLERHSLEFVFSGEEDLNAIDMAFNGKRAEDRKQWIQAYQEGDFVDHTRDSLTYSEFINKELVVFSKYDAFRSIPNCIDGLKPVQRKVLFAAFKRNLKTEIKVAQLTGYISEKTAYHHGEQSLGTTIIGMAQSFVGSNNISLLQPCGQFGSRKEGGKDASAIRYIFTRLSHLARAVFPEADDALLDYQNDDGLMVEPKYYVPVIPMVLVNGAEGIGTGWSSSVPNYNPRELIANIRRFMRGEPMEPMVPWYKGFKGTIERKGAGGFESVGIIRKLDEETLEVTELPIKMWTQNFKQFLEDSLHDRVPATPETAAESGRGRGRAATPGGSSTSSFTILDYRDNSTHETIRFTIKMSPSQMEKVEREGLDKAFKLRKPLGITNMTLFDNNLKVQRYATELDIIREFGQLRLQYYELRREYLIEKLERECRILRNKVRFLEEIIAETLKLNNRKRDVIIRELMDKKFDPLTEIQRASKIMWKLEQQQKRIESELNKEENLNEEDGSQEASMSSPTLVAAKEFEYLLGMSLWTLTSEKVKELQTQLAEKSTALDDMRRTTPEDLWEADLKTLEEALTLQDEMDEQQRAEDKVFRATRRVSLQTLRTTRRRQRGGDRGTRPGTKAKATKMKELSSELSAHSSETSLSDADDSGGDDDDDEPFNAQSRPKRRQMSDDDDDTSKLASKKPVSGTVRRKRTPKTVSPVSAEESSKGKQAGRRGKQQDTQPAPDVWSALGTALGSTTDVDAEQQERSKPMKGYSLAERLKMRGKTTNGSATAAPGLLDSLATSQTQDTSQARRQKTLEELLGLAPTSPPPSSLPPLSSTTTLTSPTPGDSRERVKRPLAKNEPSTAHDTLRDIQQHPSPPKRSRGQPASNTRAAPSRRRLKPAAVMSSDAESFASISSSPPRERPTVRAKKNAEKKAASQRIRKPVVSDSDEGDDSDFRVLPSDDDDDDDE